MYRTSGPSKIGTSLSSPSSGQRTSLAGEQSPSNIREIKSRTSTTGISSTGVSNVRQLLANKRQAISMERLNASPGSNSNSLDKDKCSPVNGSSNSINGTSSSPSRCLNRTASRVSRFRSAKAVFERLSSANNTSTPSKLERPTGSDKPRGTIASRYAAAAAARASVSQQNLPSSPRSRIQSSLARNQEVSKSTSSGEIHKAANLSNSSRADSLSQPRPQPRVAATGRPNQLAKSLTHLPTQSSPEKNRPTISTPNTNRSTSLAKPPPKDLIDKIVLEIARDADKNKPDPDCTIQDLSNCDVSGIPETLDFEKCFQDVEMMTEEEARRLLSKKPEVDTNSSLESSPMGAIVTREQRDQAETGTECEDKEEKPQSAEIITPVHHIPSSSSSVAIVSTIAKTKVRFSEEPVKVFDTHAVEDYDRRNDDIDPIAASAEYEIEKSKERMAINELDSEEDEILTIETTSGKTVVTSSSLSRSSNEEDPITADSLRAALQSPRGVPQNECHDSSDDSKNNGELENSKAKIAHEELQRSKEYIQSLERELGLKRILEQNLRDLQSQYYEAVRELDDHKSVTETKLSSLEQDLNDVKNKLESSQGELVDAKQKSDDYEKKYNDINSSSQMLEKKYHRAKRIIKDMQSREQSFSRREQLYQQKLDEIEHELGALIDSIDKTILNDGLKFYSVASSSCQIRHPTNLDAFGLLKKMLDNFNANSSTQNPQIKQRIVAILEQQMANQMLSANGNAITNGVSTNQTAENHGGTSPGETTSLHQTYTDRQQVQTNNYLLASHRLSQPNLPHPIGVGGQPTKIFGLNPTPIPVSRNEPSPPQSVNSYPSTNSLNSLNMINNNNNNSTNNNNNIIAPIKLRDQPASDLQLNLTSIAPASIDAEFAPNQDAQVPFKTNEWHDKPVSEWTTTQVSTWLLALGLDHYISKFEDRNVNGQSLINLDSTVLKGLGVLNSKDRNLLKKKIRELRVEMEKERKLIEKKLKENLKDKTKNRPVFGANHNEARNDSQQQQQTKSSWTKGLLS